MKGFSYFHNFNKWKHNAILVVELRTGLCVEKFKIKNKYEDLVGGVAKLLQVTPEYA